MIQKYSDKPVVMFSCLSVCERNGGILSDNGTAVTFNAYMAADKNKMIYTFNAFDGVRERVLKMKMKKGSRIMIVAVLKNYITTDNIIRQSYTVGFIDYCPADDNHNQSATAQTQNQEPVKPQRREIPSSDMKVYQQSGSPIVPIISKQEKKPYSFDMPEVDLEEFAMAIGGVSV